MLTFDHAFEIETDFGLLEFEVECQVWPSEPMVMYDSNGTGYPGSPAEAEVLSLTVRSLYGEDFEYDALELAEQGRLEELTQLAWEHIDYDTLREKANEIDAAYD